jgi:hypothetical protein
VAGLEQLRRVLVLGNRISAERTRFQCIYGH